MNPITQTLIDGTHVVVPDSLALITPYVLREQNDWFEDELKFLRRVVEPGARIVDIGANYGVYALSLARAAGPNGHVWAFEPASRTADFLERSVRANGLGQLSIERSALSDTVGTATLSLHDNAELNALSTHGDTTGARETVPLTTLDERMAAHGWTDIALVKMDAEGEEARILAGGRGFLAANSPLVMYEIKAGAELHLELVQAFAAHGYRSFRLVPGLGLLAPFDASEGADGFLLNLFACKPDRAAHLAARGLLVDDLPEPPDAQDIAACVRSHGWRSVLAHTAQGRQFGPTWAQRVGTDAGWDRLEAALALHAFAMDADRPAPQRFAALRESLQILQALCHGKPSGLRVASLARVAADFGLRSLAAHGLQFLADDILESRSVDPGEPFLAPQARFETVDVAGRPGEWVLAAVLETAEQAATFSSFYSGVASLPRLEAIAALGFGSDEMARRLTLVRARAAAAA